MDPGQVMEQGRHEELFARGGLYRRLWQMPAGLVVAATASTLRWSGERLRAIPLFRDVDQALEALAGSLVSRLYPPGRHCTQGDARDRLYMVVRGAVSI